jgi:hypothetical protein
MPKGVYLRPLAQERFWKFVQKTDTCWIWIGYTSAKAYGQFQVNGRPVRAHRFSWEMSFGSISEGMVVCHRCDNPSCVRPEHLFLGTQNENVQDQMRKGRRTNHAAPGEQHHGSKLTEGQVAELRQARLEGRSTNGLAARFGISERHARAVAAGDGWGGRKRVR